MEPWRRTLYLLWVGQFLSMAGISLVAPFLPLYIGELGVQDPAAQALWSGVIFAATYVVSAAIQPVWGDLADRYGRKPMALRSSLGLGIAIGLFAIARNPWQLLFFRCLQGLMAGYTVASSALVSAQTPQEKQGYALGTLQTGSIAGTVCGPLFGGLLAHVMGAYRPVFLITLVSCLVAGGLTLLVHEPPRPRPAPRDRSKAKKREPSMLLSNGVLLAVVGVTFMANFAAMTIEPTLTLFLKTLRVPPGFVEVYAGVIFAATGVATFLAAPALGRLGDRYGYRLVLTYSLLGGAGVYLLQGLVTAAWQLAVLRFFLGVAVAGLLPAAQAVIARVVPADRRGRGFGYSMSAIFWGNVLGPLVGGSVAAGFHSMRAVFPVTAAVMLLDLVWMLLRVPARLSDAAASPPGA